jgi:LAGLIDADG endonuclease/NADH dehydrogenase
MLTGNLNLTENIEAQRAVWLILPLFVIFIIFFIGSIAETNRAPFDLAEANLIHYIILAYYYITTVFISITRFIIINFIFNITIMNIYNIFSTLRTFYKLHYAAGKVNFKTIKKSYSSLIFKDSSLHPEWITGFTDGEGSFGIKIYKAKGYKLGWRLEPFFQIKLNARDIDLLYRIKEYFGGVGNISFDKNSAKYVIRKLSDIVDILIPHFEAYPLLTKKFADFELFRQIILIIKNESSLSEQGFIKILNLRYSLNNGISEELKELYPDLVPVMRPEVPERKIQPEWLVGFIDGEGSFNIITVEKKSSEAPSIPSTSYKVWLHFQITQHSRDTALMERIVTFFDCGSVKKRNASEGGCWL